VINAGRSPGQGDRGVDPCAQGVDLPRELEATKSYFHALAGEWDRKMRLDVAAVDRLEAALDELGIRAGQSVIDAGCGTGILYPYLKRRIGGRGRVLAVDLAAGMIDAARAKHGADRRFTWTAGDIVEVLEGLPPGSADRVVCFSAFPHFLDQPRALRAIYRVLSPGGLRRGRPSPDSLSPAETSQDRWRRARPSRPAEKEAGRFAIIHLKDSNKLNNFHASLENTPVRRHVLPSPGEAAAMAVKAGFRILTARETAGLYLVVGSR
jgi:ubiquinone/menaquinone biosynthesis C-methylase UbiE